MSSNKRRRSDADSKRKDFPLSREDATKAPEKSVLDSSEVSFPRGGSSALTPLELKEVANEAAKDVLFSKDTEQIKIKDLHPKKKKKTISTNKDSKGTNNEIIPNIDSLTFKSLIPGTLVLGQIQSINRLDIVISLPDNLVGFVPITSVSEIITKELEEFDDDSEDSDSEEENTRNVETSENKKKFPNLSKIFRIGQWLRAVVVDGTLNSKNKKNQKKRIQLSIESSKVNKNLEDDDLVASGTIQVTVKSVEDHGAILDIGKENIGGFISNKELRASSIDPEDLKAGSVFLATISNKNDRTVTVKFSHNKKNPVTTLSSVDSLVPGTFIETLITHVQSDGLVSRAFGLVDATISLAHAGVFDSDSLKHKYNVGSKVKARIVAVLFVNNTKKLVLSLLNHVLVNNKESEALSEFPIGHIFESVEVKGHDSNYIYVAIDSERLGQAHVSRIEGSVSLLSAKYGNGTKHQARVVGFSLADNYYSLTFDPKVIKQKYLRAEDIPLGESVIAEVLNVLPEKGLKVKIFNTFEALVPTIHMSDIKLIYPERKFKIGSKVKGKVLNVSKFKSEIIVTLKKSLVGVENPISQISQAQVGDRTSASVLSFKASGAIVSFFGNLKAFLPKSEISETFVNKPEDHLRLGQTITVRITSVDQATQKLSVSCRLSSETSEAQKKALSDLIVGRSIVKAQVVEKTKDSVVVELPGNNLRGVIFSGHLSDGNFEQNRAILKRLEIDSIIEGLVLDKDPRSRIFNLSAKKSLISAAEQEVLPTKFNEIKVSDDLISGYVKSITDKGIFVGFGAKLVGLILAKYATDKPVDDLNSVYSLNQSVSVRVLRTDEENKRFLLTTKEKRSSGDETVNPADRSTKLIHEYKPGKLTKAVIQSVKQTQLNVQLADNVQGRVDVSQIFDNFEEIKDPKRPLSQFKKGDLLDVKVIGFHDVRNHVFLPITHRKSKQLIIELSAKKSDLRNQTYESLTLDNVSIGSEWIAFINNSIKGFLFANLSTRLKGRISFMNASDDSSLLGNIEDNFPTGSAIKVKVKSIDNEHNSVLLTARENEITSFQDVKINSTYPARVLRVTESFVIVELAENVTAISFITDALDDYSDKLLDNFNKNSVVSARVLDIDETNQKIHVSLRSEKSKDKLVSSYKDLERGDVVKGFIKNITDKGLFIALGRVVTAYVKVSDLSDSYLKEWKKYYKPHQFVIGKVVNAKDSEHITLTLKESEINGDLRILKHFEDLKIGDIFEGSVRKVAEFGVFVKLDGTVNVSGLCHHSEISDNVVDNLGALFGEGDRVKVKILAIDSKKKQLSLGLKASYFQDNVEEANESSKDSESEDLVHVADDEDEDLKDASDDDFDDEEEDLVESAFNDHESEQEHDEYENSDIEEDEEENKASVGLGTNGFDWTAQILDQVQDDESSDEEDFTNIRNKKKKKTKQLIEDSTGDLDSRAPQSVGDFERLIIGNPNSSIAWMNYMSFQLQLSEIEKAREIAERALKTINYREEQEKLNIWIALLNLENSFGTNETLEEVFKRSCEYMDSLTMHQKLVSIYIISEKFDKANSLFRTITKKFGRSSVAVWVSFGSYLLDRGEAEKAHEILADALNALHKRDHIEVVRKFAQLEFVKGDAEQGRTLFEGLISDVPKRIDIWNVYIDQEIKKDEKKKVEELFERVFTKKITRKQAKFFFGKWLSFEEAKGDTKGADHVKAKAQEYVQKV
ncbi:hypothetical protein WICMUC_005039 [Wickerhamomyces mucosus]|uniref:rRNA biogenesis protein RRP5 n=1 Tax=Wickerhamomyces mucosus TaxID=1378264 RepID=A0A9P8T8H2_9ASCO|nr:hypothetical protein WICMUC_005039 [Wickerhamomyces mucosus]